MKKLILSASVVGLFFVYGLMKRTDEGGLQTMVPPVSGTPQATPSPTAGTSELPQPTAAPAPVRATPVPAVRRGRYKDGTFTGQTVDAFYGYVQVQVTVSGGNITDVRFLQYPNDRSTSVAINQQAMPYLKQEAIQAQSANVDIVSGATATSQGFRQSLASALSQAQ